MDRIFFAVFVSPVSGALGICGDSCPFVLGLPVKSFPSSSVLLGSVQDRKGSCKDPFTVFYKKLPAIEMLFGLGHCCGLLGLSLKVEICEARQPERHGEGLHQDRGRYST